MNSAIIGSGGISKDNIGHYEREGYLVAEGIFSMTEVAELQQETVAIFRGQRGNVPGLAPVAAGATNDEVLKKYLAIHFPHKLSAVISRSITHPRLVKVLTAIISPNVKCMQSMLFVKGPGKKGQSWHQDEYYIPTRDKSLTGAWIAIDEATVNNGCLWILPGRPGAILRRIPNTDPEFADEDTLDASMHPGKMIPVEVKSGSVIFFNGYTLHSSRSNRTKDHFRMALVHHYMSAESMLPWDQDGKLPMSEDLRDIVMVAGKDPYAWKGIVDVNKPFLRPETGKL